MCLPNPLLHLRNQIKKGSNTQTKVSRLLDAALGESAVKRPAKSLESALAAFDDLTGKAPATLQQQQQRQAMADLQFAEPWVRTWAQLLSRARAKLASSLLIGDDSSAANNSSATEAAAELERELQALRKKAAAAAGERVTTDQRRDLPAAHMRWTTA
jgi:hypothetical protein